MILTSGESAATLSTPVLIDHSTALVVGVPAITPVSVSQQQRDGVAKPIWSAVSSVTRRKVVSGGKRPEVLDKVGFHDTSWVLRFCVPLHGGVAMPAALPVPLREQMVRLHEEGHLLVDIAHQLNVRYSTLCSWW